MSILRLFETSLARFGGRIAVEDWKERLTYEELDRKADAFASDLQGLNLPQRSVVGIFMDGCVEYVIAVLGILKAGMVFMPLNTDFPGKRLISILEKTSPRVLVTDQGNAPGLRERLEGSHASVLLPRIITISTTGEASGDGETSRGPMHDGPASRNPSKAAAPKQDDMTDACYVIVTSGSTGQPKAILGSHAGLVHFIQWEVTEFGFTEDERISLLSPVTFDVSLRDIFAPLAVGGCLCIPGQDVIHSPMGLLEWLRERGITVSHMVPTLFRELPRVMAAREDGENLLPHLKHVLLAGEPVYGSDVVRWRQAAGEGTQLVNLYGPSETTLAKLFHRIDTSSAVDPGIVPLGTPIPDTEVLILRDGRACQVGEPGEIHIRTPYRSLGYYGDPELTREHFIQNPLANESEDIVYRTGDQGELAPDGTIRFLGRLDGQVKVHGRRIELGEIEAHLRQHQDVRQAAAVVRPDASGDPRILAYIVPEEGKSPPVESLRRFLQERLPEFMVPQVFANLEALPLTHSGKIHRQALPDLGRNRPEMEIPYVPPSNEHEKILCEVWGEVLELDRVGTRDGFFDLGGTSVSSIRLVERIRQVLGVELPVVKVFQYPTVASLSAFMQGSEPQKEAFSGQEERARRRRQALSSRRR